jgi:poly-gamma-glutamate capsule biosynthesis protein CapA/YwtB (metallophosphatase superfamily)
MSGEAIVSLKGTKAPRDSVFSFVATGDSMISSRLSVCKDAQFLRIVDVIRKADVAFTNMEGLVREPKAYPMKQFFIGSYFNGEPFLVDELRWMGFDVVSLANTHTTDYSPEALHTNMELLDRAGIAHSGAGASLTEAREPAYLETPKGRVALISADATFENGERASDGRGSVLPRPGVNGLRFESHYVVDRRAFEELKRIQSILKLKPSMLDKVSSRERPATDREIRFLGKRFLLGDRPAVHTVANRADFEDNIRWVKDARSQADYVLVSLHTHASGDSSEMPAEYVVDFAHACIDAGADAYIGHGSHTGKGIEVYRGKPILYDLGNFIFQLGRLRRHPADAYEIWSLDEKATPADYAAARDPLFEVEQRFTGVMAWFTLSGGRLSQLRLYPITLGYERHRSSRGDPVFAEGQLGKEIIERFARMSSPFGTKIEFRGGLGVVGL